jgi:UDP-N-acetylmuramyl pentapeptide phosphotransferase/UDP-N-acetylglucosamine-1-phosphate transferase
MRSFTDLGFQWYDFLIIAGIGVFTFLFTKFIYPYIIEFNLSKGWVGFDIHKKARPRTAESGGIGLIIGSVIGLIPLIIIYRDQEFVREGVVLITTIIASGIIGFIDDRIRLSSLKKIILMIGCGVPLFLMNFFGYIHVQSPTIPILGTLRLTIIYPLVLPIIIAVMTNTVNMLEGYNGEGSGTCSIALFFMLLVSLIARSAEGFAFTVPCLAAIFAFFLFNKYPAKVFPGDVGTLGMGAIIGCIAILASIEVAMFCAMLTHIFNSFYVLTSIRGFKESHDIKIKDIFVDDNDLIYANSARNAPVTLPRLIVVFGPLKEEELVRNFLALTMICGLFALIAELAKQWVLPMGFHDNIFTWLLVGCCIIVYFIAVKLYPRVFGISVIMILLLLGGVGFLYFVDRVLIQNTLNWLISGALGLIGLAIWYKVQMIYFWSRLKKNQDKTVLVEPGNIKPKEQQNENTDTNKTSNKEAEKETNKKIPFSKIAKKR